MSQTPEVEARTEVRNGMRITWHQPIEMDDGIVLRADVYRPVGDGRYPVILSYGVYANGLAYQDGYPMQWEKMVADHPEILVGSTTNSKNRKGFGDILRSPCPSWLRGPAIAEIEVDL